MALVIQAYTFAYQYANSWLLSAPKKQPNALKMGVLSAAMINPAAGKSSLTSSDWTDVCIAIHPAETHPGVILYAIASRDESTAKSTASKYGFKKYYGSYDALLADPEVDFVYISTPNGLHYEWASKAVKGTEGA